MDGAPTPATPGAAGQLRTLTIRITEDLRAQLDIIAQLMGRSATEEIRLAIEHWIAKTKSDPELLKQAEAVRADIEREAQTRRNAIAAIFHHESSQSRTALIDEHDGATESGRLSHLPLNERADELDAAIRDCRRQSTRLRQELPGGHLTRLEHLAKAVGIEIRPHADMPFPATSFIGYGRCQIHVAESLPPSEQLRAAAHELKFVLDYLAAPEGGHPSALSDADREHIAAHFAAMLLEPVDP